jgi:hypothetical protein
MIARMREELSRRTLLGLGVLISFAMSLRHKGLAACPMEVANQMLIKTIATLLVASSLEAVVVREMARSVAYSAEVAKQSVFAVILRIQLSLVMS